MAFDDLLLRLWEEKGEQASEDFRSYAERIIQADKAKGPVVIYGFAISDSAQVHQLHNKMVNLGGFCVLAHCMAVTSPEVAKNWRGTEDLDIVCRDAATARELERLYGTNGVFSLSLPDKRKFQLSDPTLEKAFQVIPKYEVDLYYPKKDQNRIQVGTLLITPEDFDNSEVIDIYGVPIRVLSAHRQLQAKLGIKTGENIPRKKDICDIFDLLGILEKKGTSPKEVLKKLGESESEMLSYLLNLENTHELRNHPYALVPARKTYLRELRKASKPK